MAGTTYSTPLRRRVGWLALSLPVAASRQCIEVVAVKQPASAERRRAQPPARDLSLERPLRNAQVGRPVRERKPGRGAASLGDLIHDEWCHLTRELRELLSGQLQRQVHGASPSGKPPQRLRSASSTCFFAKPCERFWYQVGRGAFQPQLHRANQPPR